MECTSVLGNDVQRPSQGAECPAMDAVAVGSTHHIRAGGMDRRMDHKRSRIQQPTRTALDHVPLMAYANQIRGFDLGECHAERIDPERGRFDGVSDGDVSSDAWCC